MIERARHVPLRPVPWDPSDIATAIEEIVLDALGHFDNEGFWPAHPLDELRRGGNSSVYLGASGVIWALDYLWRAGATKSHRDFRPVLSQLLERTGLEMQSFGDYAKHGSLLCGDLGTALVIMRLAPTLAIADIVHARVTANMELLVRELMWAYQARCLPAFIWLRWPMWRVGVAPLRPKQSAFSTTCRTPPGARFGLRICTARNVSTLGQCTGLRGT